MTAKVQVSAGCSQRRLSAVGLKAVCLYSSALFPVAVRVGFAFNEILRRLNEIKRAAGDDVVFAERHLVACEGPHFQRFYGKAGTSGDIGEPDVDFATRGQAESYIVVPDGIPVPGMIGRGFHP
ncbi:hypothetical protein CKO_02291 [Citrobacter koseri ATCC BAA-895]|uniref:Uncharacterized protein n=1 Tax=Citrobacter koseri (strain ATCC BAA-895 / CDC 4225-83 / SGSC4696) TaxID=290338 RepID=A8AIU9_CITK8|nr:hypothetical protein CKO_02291 [Citrobacter koseri ATCC BAA-895]